jgi:predicted house-cleaning noncanonical NTP pyrophosphatase (MazG superfamily)
MKNNKLVRDRIPEIIEKSGKIPITRTLTDAEFKVFLEKKLDEEVAEFNESHSLEELADIWEVVYSLCHAYGTTPSAVNAFRAQKRQSVEGSIRKFYS